MPNCGKVGTLLDVVANGDLSKVKQHLHDHGCSALLNTTWSGQNALHIAAYWGYSDICNELITRGIGVESTDRVRQITALHIACFSGQREVCSVLLSNNASLLHAKDINNNTPIDVTNDVALKQYLETFRPAAPPLNGEISKPKVTAMADTTAPRDRSKTLLDFAGDNRISDMIDLLKFNAKAVTRTNWAGQTALHIAAYQGHSEACELLIEQGVDVNAVDDLMCRSALHLASARGHAAICELLINSNAACEGIKDNQFNTAVDYAPTQELKFAIQRCLTKQQSKRKTPDRSSPYFKQFLCCM